MNNMLGGEELVDVSNLVIRQGYKPIYCGINKDICALINPKPSHLTDDYEKELKNGFKEWVANYKSKFNLTLIDSFSIITNSTYQYSYLITFEPVDVYLTKISIDKEIFKAFFRIEKGKLLLPYDEDGWVIF